MKNNNGYVANALTVILKLTQKRLPLELTFQPRSVALYFQLLVECIGGIE